MADNTQIFTSYAEFWPFYLGQHSKRATRLVHIVGTLLALVALAKAILCLSLIWLLTAFIIGYGAAWVTHHFIEKNHPATFGYPLWSLRGDFYMTWLWLNGRLEVELMRYGILD
jgi:hypothetical protein